MEPIDYKALYEDAHERAKQIKYGNPSSGTAIVVCEQIFPDLKESEDERIRKNLISFLEALYAKGKSAYDGEQWSKSDCADWIAYLEKQKETLHISESCKENSDSFTGWSEEDKKNLELVIDCIYEFYPDPVMKYKLKDWLKSLRPQPKPSWSEEDQLNLNWVIAILNGEPCELDIQLESLISWLKSLRPQPHWKPSEEPIDGVLYAAACGIKNKGQIEKSEKPIEGFDGEFSKFSNDVDAEHPFPICVDEYKDFARHFYELGRQSKEEDVIIQKARTEKQRVLVTETDGNANVFWDARSLDDVKALLLCGLDFIKKQSKEQPVCEELGEEINRWMGSTDCFPEGVGISPLPKAMEIVERTARHFYELGRQSECVKVKAESALDKFMLENCTHCLIEHCPGMRECYTSSNKQLQ